MHRIDGPGHQANMFTEGDPALAVPATDVTAAFMNAVQEEIAKVVQTGGGLALSKPDNTQLWQAIGVMINATLSPTGVMRITFDTAAAAGWLPCSGRTIGNAVSGATERANADAENLFTHIWNRTANAGEFVIQDNTGAATVRGASAAADFAAAKRLPLPDYRDRVVVGKGDMGGVAANRLTIGGVDSDTAGFNGSTLGTVGGSEKTQRHTHIQNPHEHTGGAAIAQNSTLGSIPPYDFNQTNTGPATATNQNAFVGQSGNVQPSAVAFLEIKL